MRHAPGQAPGRLRTALLVPAALLLSGCGIPSTGVVESGEPATGAQSPALVYFVRDGALVPVPRTSAKRFDLSTAMALLLKGPDPVERKEGLSTLIPPMKADPKVGVEGAKVSVVFYPGSRPLKGAGLQQLICTVAHARQVEDPGIGLVSVTVTGSLGGSGTWRAEGSTKTCAVASSPADAALQAQRP
ncbi:hypothetical protein OG607_01335 [Streptomyces sp. NBC_01537]|uniref:hypothetical protein n=1 Tax=Streptomyces sp. NBC_01537 TaxID=2903896 RepID=UPI003863C609